MSSTDCLFCRIASGDLPAERLFEDDALVAFRDIHPQAPVHVLLIPRRHIASLTELDEEHTELIGRIHLTARALAEEEGVGESGWRLVTNVGGDGGQTVDHLHFHLLGGRALRWPPG